MRARASPQRGGGEEGKSIPDSRDRGRDDIAISREEGLAPIKLPKVGRYFSPVKNAFNFRLVVFLPSPPTLRQYRIDIKSCRHLKNAVYNSNLNEKAPLIDHRG